MDHCIADIRKLAAPIGMSSITDSLVSIYRALCLSKFKSNDKFIYRL